MGNRLLTTLLAFFSIFTYLFAQNTPNFFRVVSSEDGLTSNRINTIYKDARGFIWVGTQVGINRFDGIHIKQFPTAGTDEVFAIAESDDKMLWIGSENGLRILDRSTNEVQEVNLGISSSIVKAIEVIDDEVILATNRGAFTVKNGKVKHIVFEGGVSNANSLTGIIRADNNDLWFSSQSGICHYQYPTGKTAVYKHKESQTDYNNYTSIAYGNGIIYAGSYNKGVVSFDTTTKQFEQITPFIDNYILTLKLYHGELYVGTNGSGLKIYSLTDKSTRTIRHNINEPHSINSNAIYSFLLDKNIFWVGTYKGGLNYTPHINPYFKTYRSKLFNSYGLNIRSLHIAHNGDKMIGTRDGFVFESEKRGIVRRYTQSDRETLISDIILYIAPYKENKYLVGTYGGGAYIYDTERLKFSRFRDEEVFLSGCIFRFIKSGKKWWFATDKGLYEYNEIDNKITNYNTSNSRLLHNNITYMYQDTQNRLWLATSDGLSIFDTRNKNFSDNIFANYPALKIIEQVLEDSQGNIWVSSHQAIAMLNSSLSAITPMIFNQESVGASSIIEDSQQRIWFATTQGIVVYNLQNHLYKTYNISDGLLGYDFTNVVQRIDTDNIWWTNERGLIHCYLPDLNNIKEGQKPVITAVSSIKNPKLKIIENTPEFTSSASFPSDQNDISIKFSQLDYSIAPANIYEYMLEKYDEEWKTQIGNNEATYYSLPSGSYVFRLRDPNNHNFETAIEINIKRDKWLVYRPIIWSVLILIILLVGYKYRALAMAKLRSRKESKEKYVNSKIDDTVVKKVAKLLEDYMVTEKPYLNTELKQTDVARKIQVSTTELSQILNQHMGLSFSDYINKYRIDELVDKMKDKTSSRYTLTALAEQCGFSSRSSFFRAIKKHTGQTPADFLKKIEKK